MTLQEMFDRVTVHLLTQNRRAMAHGYHHALSNGCRYRTEEGLTCAIGCLVDPELYSPKMENKSLIYPEVRDPVIQSLGITAEQFDAEGYFKLLDELRIVHDRGHVSDWRSELKAVAQSYELEWKHDEDPARNI